MKLRITVLALIAILALSACDPNIPGGPTIPTLPTTPTVPVTQPATAPAQVSGLKLVRVEQVGDSGNTYNAFFSWEASATPGVKYCVSTTAEGYSGEVEGGCAFENQYLTSDTFRGFGLVFNKNRDYKVSVTTIDSNNRKSSVTSLTWRVPTKVATPSALKLDRVEQVFGNTYNAFFSWNASLTKNVKYCVSTSSVGIDGVTVDNNSDANCSFDGQYISSATNAGFGLVFDKNTTYEFRVTAIDSNNQKSITKTMIWELP